MSSVSRTPCLTLLVLGGCLSGCSLEFGADMQDVPLVGQAPQLEGVPRLNRGLAQFWYPEQGGDGAPWIAICESGSDLQDDSLCQPGVLRFRRVLGPEAEAVLSADHIYLGEHTGYRAFYAVQPSADKATTTLLIQHPKDLSQSGFAPGMKYVLPGGQERLIESGDHRVFLYWVPDSPQKTFDVIYRDQAVHRTLDVPDGYESPERSGVLDPFFDRTGRYLFTRDRQGVVRATSTLTPDKDEILGQRPRSLRAYPDTNPTLITCGDDGLRSVPFDDPHKDEVVLDLAPPCLPSRLLLTGGLAVYQLSETRLRQIPLDGTPAKVVDAGQPVPFDKRVLYADDKGHQIYSRDPPGRYIYDAGDGWLGDWRFMDRGFLVFSPLPFSRDQQRLRWVDHAANPFASGDLLSATVPGGEPLRLAKNASTSVWELLDGRLVAVTNDAFPGTHNRVILIDEQARMSHWLADSADNFWPIPGTDDLLVSLVTGGSGFDLVRLPVPPK